MSALFTARHRLFRQGGLTASAISASAGRKPRRGGPGASASRRAGNLKSCPGHRGLPGCRGSQISQFLVPAATSAGATGGGEARAGGCAGRHACPPEWPRRVRAGGGHGLPRGPAPRVSRVAMEVSSLGGATRARECPFGRRRRPQTRQRAEIGCPNRRRASAASGRRQNVKKPTRALNIRQPGFKSVALSG